ncbi:MAG: FAD-binding oxidoreductase [Acidiferrobacterales bacterium]
MATNDYEKKKQRLMDELRNHEGNVIGIAKTTSNLFRDRAASKKYRLGVGTLKNVLEINPETRVAEIEAMASYADIVDATLPHGVLPTVVPELKSITIGGAVSGIGIESSSFKYGLAHEGVLEMEILLADGNTVIATPDNEHRDLFFAFPNSYGTFGYVLKLKIKLVPVRPYVRLTHVRYEDISSLFEGINDLCNQDIDFLDGTVFGHGEMYVTTGKYVHEAPYTSDYTYENIYYHSIRRRERDYLTILDYIWRWDTDWFWCSKNLFAEHALVRALVGKSRLNSVTYTKIMRWNSRWRLTHRLNRLLGYHTESVIQDVDIAIDKAPEFLDFFQREVGITPIWICPVRAYDKSRQFDLYAMDPSKIYINFGFWDEKKGRIQLSEGHYNRQIEQKVVELGGIKSLYSDSYFGPDEFWHQYNKAVYDKIKSRYDPQARLKDIYQKCVLRQ